MVRGIRELSRLTTMLYFTEILVAYVTLVKAHPIIYLRSVQPALYNCISVNIKNKQVKILLKIA